MEDNKPQDVLSQIGTKVKDTVSKVIEFVKNIGKDDKGIDGKTSFKYKASRRIVDRKRFVISCGIIALLTIGVFYVVISGSAYTIKINGIEIGKVKTKKDVDNAIEVLKQKYKTENNSDINFISEISLEKSRASAGEILKDDSLLESLSKNIKYSVQACSIYVDGSPVAILKTKDIADDVLNEVQRKNFSDADLSKLKEISFAEKIELKEEYVDLSKLISREEALALLTKGTTEVKDYTIESGDTFWTIAKKNNMSLEDLEKANPGVNSEKIQIGQVISLVVPKPFISVKTVETITSIEKIQYEQKVEFSNSIYKDQTSVKIKGVYGEKEVTADVTKVNGIETERTVLKEKVIKEPKTQVIVKGTKEPPPKKGTGTFAYPARGTISSRFGMRWGRRHNGIDIAAKYGTDVKAADGGAVIWVGYEGGLGKLIKIDHGANYVTYYGHLSKYSVKKGDKVYKGQKIGEVGNTGNSTGPHLHFEIRKNGVPQNPSSYLK